MSYKLFKIDEDGGKHYIFDGDLKNLINEDDDEFKAWVAEGNTPEPAD